MKEYAIIRNSKNSLLTIIPLGEYESYEWGDFSVLKNKEDKDIVWFENEDDAVEFLITNFNKNQIDPKHFKETSIDGKYYID